MPQNKDYAPATTVIYIAGDRPTDRADRLKVCLFHACTVTGEDWLAEPKFETNLANAVEAIQQNPGQKIDFEEADWHPPIQHLLIFAAQTEHGDTDTLQKVMHGAADVKTNGTEYTVIVPDVDTLCTRDAGFDRIQHLLDASNTVHFAQNGIALTPRTDIKGSVKQALMNLSGVVHPSHENDTEGQYAWSGGRPPLGFKVADSGDRLVETDDYAAIRRVLQQVVDDIKSKRRAAKDLDCTRATVTACIEERPSMYSLDK